MSFFPETEGNLANRYFHCSYFTQHLSLFSGNFQNKLKSFFDVFKRLFFCISFTDSDRNFKALGGVSPSSDSSSLIVNRIVINWWF